MNAIISDSPEAWIGCVSCYTNGRLTGEWMDLLTDPLPTLCPDCQGEEFWVYDIDGFGPFLKGRCSPMDAANAAALIEQIRSDGYDPAAVGAYADELGETITEWDAPTRNQFDDAFCGEYPSFRDYADEYADEILLANESAIVRQYFDYDSFANDLMMDHYVVESDGGVFIFRVV